MTSSYKYPCELNSHCPRFVAANAVYHVGTIGCHSTSKIVSIYFMHNITLAAQEQQLIQ